MESLVSILESYDINESFKSQTLRDLMSVIDKDAFKAEGKYILPRGIAWDKIEEKDVFYGETGDASFYKNFVSKKEFICLWYPLVRKDIMKTSRRRTRYLEPGRFLITSGAYFIQSSGNIEDQENFKGTVKELPSREAIDVPVDEMLIVELYSK